MSDTAPGVPPRYTPFASPILVDPYPAYERLREAGALARGGPATWAVTRYAEVVALLQDERLGHAPPEEMQRRLAPRQSETSPATQPPTPSGGNPVLGQVVSSLDPPSHTQVRALMNKALLRVPVHELRDKMRTWTDELLALVVERTRFDAVRDFAQPLQISIACDLLGVPEADRCTVVREAMALGRTIILLPFMNGDRGKGDESAGWLRRYVGDMLRERSRAAGHDLISSMLLVRDGDRRLSDQEIVDNAVFLLFAGFETSIFVVSSALAILARSPHQWALLREDRSLVPRAVEEILRLDAPLQWVSRIATRPIEVADRVIRPGWLLLLLLGSANRDQRQFRDPKRLDVTRHPNRHVSFGGGSHQCMGMATVRAQAAIVLNCLLDRCSDLELDGEPAMIPHPVIRAYDRMSVTVKPA